MHHAQQLTTVVTINEFDFEGVMDTVTHPPPTTTVTSNKDIGAAPNATNCDNCFKRRKRICLRYWITLLLLLTVKNIDNCFEIERECINCAALAATTSTDIIERENMNKGVLTPNRPLIILLVHYHQRQHR